MLSHGTIIITGADIQFVHQLAVKWSPCTFLGLPRNGPLQLTWHEHAGTAEAWGMRPEIFV